MGETLRNWAGNHTYAGARLHHPETVEQVRQLVVRARSLKVLGTRHSFNGIADTAGDLVSLERMARLVVVDPERRTATVDGGITYSQLCQALGHQNLALHNLPSLPHITVAGACATATHGSGDSHGNVATAVSALEFVSGEGELVALSRARHGALFDGAVVALGGLGVVTKLTLDVHPAFTVRQHVYEELPLARLDDHFDEIVSSAYSVSLFTDWRHPSFHQVWLKRRVELDRPAEAEPTFFGARLATSHLGPAVGGSPVGCTEQMGIHGPWHERLPHFHATHTLTGGTELQSEYLVPRRHALPALRAVQQLGGRIAPLLHVSEVRTVAADALWMSPCYRQACVAIHFTWRHDWPAVRTLLPVLEARLAPFDARPHWGKLFAMPAARVQALFQRLPDFRRLLRRYDPEGKFRNDFLDEYVFSGAD